MKLELNGRLKNEEGKYDSSGADLTVRFKDAAEMKRYQAVIEDELYMVDFCVEANDEEYSEFYIQGTFHYTDKADVKLAYAKAKKAA